MTKLMMKFGMAPNFSIGQGAPSKGTSMINSLSGQNPMGSIMQLATKLPDQSAQGVHGFENKSAGTYYGNILSKTTSDDTPFATRSEKVLDRFLQNPILKGEGRELNEVVRREFMSSYVLTLFFLFFLFALKGFPLPFIF